MMMLDMDAPDMRTQGPGERITDRCGMSWKGQGEDANSPLSDLRLCGAVLAGGYEGGDRRQLALNEPRIPQGEYAVHCSRLLVGAQP